MSNFGKSDYSFKYFLLDHAWEGSGESATDPDAASQREISLFQFFSNKLNLASGFFFSRVLLSYDGGLTGIEVGFPNIFFHIRGYPLAGRTIDFQFKIFPNSKFFCIHWSEMKLLIIGHSYVKSLSKLKINKFSVGERSVQIKFLYKSGATYDSILNKTQYLDLAEEYNPDFILIVLAGNSLNNSISNSKIYEQIREFYFALRSRLPKSYIISAQCELRFYGTENKWNSPTEFEYRKRRSSINKFLNRLKLKDYVLNISGPGRLDDKKYYKRDGVHLTDKGVKFYFRLIKSTVRYIIEKKF